MIPINRTYAPLQALVEELKRCGMRNAVTCPGSRNAPLTLVLAAQEGLSCTSVIDERAAGFVALGMAKASGLPVAVTCTSGTAAANLHPAVAEAREARVPLIVLTADRPPELRDVGAGQAIDQLALYGRAAKWFVEVGNMEPGRDAAVHYRALACRAYWTALGGRPGVVHLNFPLREPLAPVAEDGLEPRDWAGREDAAQWGRAGVPGALVDEREGVSTERPWVEVRSGPVAPSPDAVDALVAAAEANPRGVLVCGPGSEEVAEPAVRLAAAAGWPVLAEPTSGVRCGAHDRAHVVAHYDVLLKCSDWAGRHTPGLVVRVGDTPTSKSLRAWVADAEQVVVDPHAAWHEPTRAAGEMVWASAALTLDAVAARLDVDRPVAEAGWLQAWLDADAVVGPALASAPDPFEPKLLAGLEPALPDGAVVWVSSSMPIRDVEAFFPSSPKRLRFLANRGANGIDGVVSSAAGAALATGSRVFLLIGELALLHDVGGLLAATRAGAELTIVCLNNGGGGIFDFLPVAEHADAEAFEEHIATPAGVDLERVAALCGLEHVVATDPSSALDAPRLVEVRTERARNLAEHRAVVERVGAGLP